MSKHTTHILNKQDRNYVVLTVLFMERKSSDFKYNTKNIKKKNNSITD